MKIEMVPVKYLIPRSDNKNEHSDEQIERLAKIIEHQGFRRPIIISNRSGKIVCGHGRLEAAKKLGLKIIPAIFQDYESEDQEYLDHVADNAIAFWADLNLSQINDDLGEIGPFDIDLLGIKDFQIEVADKEKKKQKPCPNCGYPENSQNSDANSRLVEVNNAKEDGPPEATPIQTRTDGKPRGKTTVSTRSNRSKKAKRK